MLSLWFTTLLMSTGWLVLAAADANSLIPDLQARLSPSASISSNTSSAPRWSDYHAPQPGLIVHVANEQDVAETVRYCNAHSLPFLAQSGGHGWANTFTLAGPSSVLIDLRNLNNVTVSPDRQSVRVGGGAINGELIEAASEAGVRALNGGCNCVGVLGATLGGGVSRFMNVLGLPADNVIGAQMVVADGSIVDVSETENTDLLWAIRGAGANFGIVTEVVMRVQESVPAEMFWSGQLTFEGDKLEQMVEVIDRMNFTEELVSLFGYSWDQDRNEPVVTVEVLYLGDDEEAGRQAWADVFALEPLTEETGLLPYTSLNDDTEELCEDGGRKPGWHVGLRTLETSAFREIWEQWVEFVQRTELWYTTVMVECYSNHVLREEQFQAGNGRVGASYPHRDIEYYAWIIPLWEDESMDAEVEDFAGWVRDVWRENDGFEEDVNRAYLNFAHGGEPLEEIYGESLSRLRELKREWDPEGRFNQFFPITY